MKLSRLLLCVAALATLAWGSAQADDDPPGRVARLQYLSGQVSLQPGGAGEWFEASVNRPLTSHDNLWADKNSRAELSLGSALLSVDAESSLTLSEVNDYTLRAKLNQGSLAVHVRRLYPNDLYEIQTPSARIALHRAGDYRIDVDAEGAATVTVWKGLAQAVGVGATLDLGAGDHALLDDQGSIKLSGEPTADDFDHWRAERDARLDRSPSAANLAPDVIGSEDLDDHGVWSEAPAYGRIWVPTVRPDWAPYRYGHWTWIEPWGWTWIDDEPWGFAPFHYGRWVWWNDRWCWAPGPRMHRAFYAPAMVTWFGGPHWGVEVGFGAGLWGWAPLGWGEPFYPWYRGGPHYFERVNVRNTTIVNINVYADRYQRRDFGHERWVNASRPGGMSAVEGRQMGMRASDHLARVDANQLRTAPVSDRAAFARPAFVGEGRAMSTPGSAMRNGPALRNGVGAREGFAQRDANPALRGNDLARPGAGNRATAPSPAAERMSRVPRPGANVAPASRDPQAGGARFSGGDRPSTGAGRSYGGEARPGSEARGGSRSAAPERQRSSGERSRSPQRSRSSEPSSSRREGGERRR